MAEELDLRDQLGQALYDVLYVLHRTYPNTTGPVAGIGGQAMTTFCFVNNPYTAEDSEILQRVEGVVLEWIKDKQTRDDGVHMRSKAADPGGARYE